MHLSLSGGDPATRVLTVAGELDMAVAEDLRSAAVSALDGHGVRRLVLDFADVTFLDCAGITALLGVAGQARERGARAVLVHCRPAVLRVLDATGVTDRLLA